MSFAASSSGTMRERAVALVWADGSPRRWMETISQLRRIASLDHIVVAVPDVEKNSVVFGGVGTTVVAMHSLSRETAYWYEAGAQALLLITAPISTSSDLLDQGLEWTRNDPRVATVSFLSNAAGYLSFPFRNTVNRYSLEGHDESTLTRLLRSTPPKIKATHIAAPAGAAVLIGRGALGAAGGLLPEFDDFAEASVVEFGLRASRRGFFNVLDSSTYYTRPWDLQDEVRDPCRDDGTRHRLHMQHHFFPALHDHQRDSTRGPLAQALDLARAKMSGLRILIDGSCLGPIEMGTQVQTLSLIAALAEHPQVQYIGVGVVSLEVPGYARHQLSHPKIHLFESHDLTFSGAPQVDIIHRPFQPGCEIPWARWRSLAKRCLCTIQDLIAYRNGAYHFDGEKWLEYRHHMQVAVRNSDGVVSISDDVVETIEEEKLSVSKDRLFTVKNGTDHIDDSVADAIPMPVAAKGWAAAPFAVVLGASYAHKNRDLAVKVWRRLTERGHPLKLILAGAAVARGSTRIEEAIAHSFSDDMLTMPDVSSEERNWLLRHASVVLYPTSAEGFGLVPFEAARFGTPTVYTSFGPLRELAGTGSAPATWDVDALVSHAEKVIGDPTFRRDIVAETLQSVEEMTWAATGRGLVEAYMDVLSRPDLA